MSSVNRLQDQVIDEAHLSAFELEQPHEATHAHRLVDERSDQVRSRDREINAPRLVERHPRDDARVADVAENRPSGCRRSVPAACAGLS